MHAALRASGQVPEEKRIDISEQQLASGRSFPCAGNILEQPTQLQTAEVRAQRQSSLRTEAALPAFPGEELDIFRNPRVLPNNRIGNRLAGFALPQDGGLPLIRDADRRQIRSAQPALLERPGNYLFCAPLNFQRIVLHPTRLWENLFVLPLGYSGDTPGLVKYHESRARRALIDCSNIVFHCAGPLFRRSSILRNRHPSLHANRSAILCGGKCLARVQRGVRFLYVRGTDWCI